MRMNPNYPIYVISKGRWESRLTSKALEQMKISYHIVVEQQEYDNYSAVIDPEKIYVLPFNNLGLGSIPARNWCWNHSVAMGSKRHWIIDDNIRLFAWFNHNKVIRCNSGSIFRACEDFVNRYENIALAGMQYFTFVQSKGKPPTSIKLNTRIYSCILIDNRIPYRWRGRYNEDTDLSLCALKDGWCTVMFNTFVIDKATTMTMKGGNTESLYKLDNEDGRLLMAQSLQRQHPDVVKIVRKWGRWQHQVDYRPFKGNKLKLKEGIQIPEGVNNYGMKLVKLTDTSNGSAELLDVQT